jgi:hypothetical protein
MLMRYAFAFLLVFVLNVAVGADARAEELQDREAIQTEVYDLLREKDFAALETMAEDYRTNKARTSSGLWKLTLFYVGIQRAFYRQGSDWAVQTAQAWVGQYPQSPTAQVVYAAVIPSAEEIRVYLEAHKAVAAQDPRWYEMMAEVAYTQSWPRARFTKMIEEGLDRMPSYYPIYFAAVDYFSPKWGGSAADIESFARKAVERTRQTDGWGIYARIYWYASQTEFGDRLFTGSLVNWSDMKKGMDDVLRHYADGWNLANFVMFACLKGDGQKMKELTDRMDDEAWSVWDDQEYSEKCKALSAN